MKLLVRNIYSLLLICLLFTATPLQAAIISKIEFVGNNKTADFVLLQEMQTKVGEQLDIKTVESDVQAIMDLSLFREVKYFLHEEEDQVFESNVKLVIQVREKRYLFILPEIKMDEDDNRLYYGVRAYWDNIAGSNKSLRFRARENGKVLGVRDIRQNLTFRVPRLNGSPYTLEVFNDFRDAAVEADSTDPQLREEFKYGFAMERWLNSKGRSSGWYIGAGLYTEERNNEAMFAGDISLPDFRGDFLELRLGYKKINEYLYNRRGKDVGYIVNTNQLFSSDQEDYTKHLFFYRSYYRLKSNPLNNLNVQVQLGFSNTDYLGDTVFDLGGRSLRGYEKAAYTGNAMLQMNVEYLLPFSLDPAYRYGFLFDAGNTYERASDIDISALHPSIGFGFRWKLAAFVKVNIRLDFAYAIDTGGSSVLLGSRHVF